MTNCKAKGTNYHKQLKKLKTNGPIFLANLHPFKKIQTIPAKIKKTYKNINKTKLHCKGKSIICKNK